MQAPTRLTLSFALSVAVVFGIATQSCLAQKIKIGLLKVSTSGPVLIAEDKGYFAKEGLVAEFFFTDQPPLLTQGVTAGDLDFALAAPRAAFLNIAGQGALRIIASNVDEAPGFVGNSVVGSNQAYASGLKTLGDLGGHSFAITGAGSPGQYVLAVLAQKHNFDYASVKMVPLGSFPNVDSAVIGGSVDSSVTPSSPIREALASGKLHRLSAVGDEMRMVLGVTFTSGKTADEKGDVVQRFLRAYRAGAQDYHSAFTDQDERHDGSGAAQVYAILSKYLDTPVDLLKLGIGYVDAQGRLDVADIQRQIAFYKSQGMVKLEVDGLKIIDMRYVLTLPEK